MYDIFNELVSKTLAERQKKKKEEEAALAMLSSNNPYANEVNLNSLTPAQRAQLAAVNTQTKQSNENATLPTLSAADRAGLKAELDKTTSVTVPTTSTTKPTETDTTKGEKEKDTESATLEPTLVEILKKLQTGYTPSDEVKTALDKWNAHLDTKPTEWNGGSYLNPLNDIIGQINNRSPFAYDVNADALYQMYKDQYMVGGKTAMMDTMGQASAMTGGFGNSYANMVGNQAYQGYMQGLNETVPELYQLALSKYNAEGDALYDKANLYKAMYDQEYGEHIDDVNRWYTEGERLGDVYASLADQDYGKYVDDYNKALAEYQLAIDATKPTEVNIDNVPNSIIEKLDNITNLDDLNTFVSTLVEQGNISLEVGEALYNKYKSGLNLPTTSGSAEIPYMERTWEMVSNGGANWGSIDEDAIIKDSETGDTMTLKELENAIITELKDDKTKNYSSNKIRAIAHNYVVELQRKLGISNAGAIWDVPEK